MLYAICHMLFATMFRYKITVTGAVQGVGYRYFVVIEANRLNLVGCVKNISNGDVEIIAEGKKNILESFVGIVSTKHKYATINDIKVSKTEIAKNEFSDFNVTF